MSPERGAVPCHQPCDQHRRPCHRRRSAGYRQGLREERGSATVAGAGLIIAVLALLVIGLQLGSAVVARHRAEASADLAALASAAQSVASREAACRSAARVAERMSTTLVSCELDGWDAIVQVSARPSRLIERFGVANATARAGPVRADQSADGGAAGNPRRAVDGHR